MPVLIIGRDEIKWAIVVEIGQGYREMWVGPRTQELSVAAVGARPSLKKIRLRVGVNPLVLPKPTVICFDAPSLLTSPNARVMGVSLFTNERSERFAERGGYS